jgi:ubiquinone/menaquinone biosynthesis C-methylase UbiE
LDLLELPVGARVLDCPCGQGRHSRLLAESGLSVDAVDLSRHLLAEARKEGKQRGLKYTRADMRRLPRSWTGRFHAVLNLFTSFGFFLSPGEDALVADELCRVLAPGGILIWHGANRDVVASRFAERDWWQAKGGTTVMQERAFDPLSGVITVKTRWSSKVGKQTEREHRIRLYTATRLAELFAPHGVFVEEAMDGQRFGAISRSSSSMLLVARKEI